MGGAGAGVGIDSLNRGGSGLSNRRGARSSRGGGGRVTSNNDFTDYAEIVEDEGDYSNPTTAQGFEIDR